MVLTIDFRETIRERARQEPLFRKALLREAIELMLCGGEKTGRAILRKLHQRHAWLSPVGRGHIHPGDQPHANVRTQRQPFREKPVRRSRSSSIAGGRECRTSGAPQLSRARRS